MAITPTFNSCFFFYEINNQLPEFDNRGMILNELKHLRRSKGFESRCKTVRACLPGGGGPQVGEVAPLGRLTRLSI